MMTKMTQEDSLKRLNDKVKDLLVEIDTQENLLSATCLKLQSDQYQLREDVTRAMVELKVLEESNFLLMKESYSNLCIGLELFVSRFFETIIDIITVAFNRVRHVITHFDSPFGLLNQFDIFFILFIIALFCLANLITR